MKVIDARTLAKRNMATNGAGQLSTRPGMRRLLNASTSRFYGGFTNRDGTTGDVQHIIIAGESSAPVGLELRVYDENFALQATVSLLSNAIPRAVTVGMVLRQVMIGSPEFPTLWGIQSGTYRIATKVENEESGLSAIEVPDGILTQWLNRIVVANGTALYFSDAVAVTGGSPRTFYAQNQNNRPGAIFGLHVSGGGMLMACTDQGVYGLDPAAAAVGIIGSNGADWRKLSDHETTAYSTTCTANGRLYGLTKRGYRLIDTEDGAEVDLDDPMMTRAIGTRVSLDDYRACRIYGGAEGPIISCDSIPAVYVTEQPGGVDCWWTATTTAADMDLRVFGLLRDVDGSDLLLTAGGVYAMGGNFDGTTALTGGFAAQPVGGMFGTLPSRPDENETIRKVHVSVANTGARAALRGDLQTSAIYVDNVYGPVIGTSSWGGAWRHMTAPTVAHRLDFDVNSNDLAVEVGLDGCDNRIQPVVVLDDGVQGKNRPQDRG